MRTPTLQYLYLQKPVTMAIVICIISVLPWIGMGDFSTKGEPREAAVAISMLHSDNWVLPQVYANEFAYKPPMAHWLMAVFSYPQGHVSEFTSRLPSTVAFVVLIGFVLVFFGKRMRFQQAFIATLLLITCIEIHRAAMTARVDMLLTTFIVLGLFQLYRWEDKLELKGLPVVIPFLLGCAVLIKGPVGIVLPLFVFTVYLLMLRRYSLRVIIRSLVYIGLSSSFLPLLWYLAAYKQGGDNFLSLVLAENFGRFFHLGDLSISYDLGHENGVWYNFMTLAAGFVPWTLFFVFSLFGMKLLKLQRGFKDLLIDYWNRILNMDKVKLFSLVSLVCILFFYSIPSSKRSVYLMPAYPFIAIFLAQYVLYITEYRMRVTRIFAGFLASLVFLIWGILAITMSGIIEPLAIVGGFTQRASTLNTVSMVTDMLHEPGYITISIMCLVLFALLCVVFQMFKKINIKILYATIFLTFSINLLIDGVVMRGIRQGGSCRPFAEEILKEYPLKKGNVYVMNNLREYRNLYGLNFYMGNIFDNFETDKPSNGYFLSVEGSMEKVVSAYKDTYTFTVLRISDRPVEELRDKIVLSRFTKRFY